MSRQALPQSPQSSEPQAVAARSHPVGEQGQAGSSWSSSPRQLKQGLQLAQLRAAGTLQLDNGKQARAAEVQRVLKVGRAHVGAGIGDVRAYLGGDEQNYVFLAGVIKGGFGFASLGRFLKVINDNKEHAKNAQLQQDISGAFSKVISFKETYSAVLSSGLAEFREGRISEFQGLAGELNAAAQFIKAGKTVNRLGNEYGYGDSSVQEVDVTVSSEAGNHFVEVAATPSKLKEKLSGGLDGSYPQLRGYQALSREHPGSRVAYSCPTLQIRQISPELIDKVERANVELVIAGQFHNAASLRQLVEEQQGDIAEPKKKTGKSHKQTERNDRPARLKDRGERPTSGDLLSQALRDYHLDEEFVDEAEDDYDD